MSYDQTRINTCKNATRQPTEEACTESNHCEWREVICFQNTYWLRVKNILSSSNSWFTGTSKLKPGEILNYHDK